MEKESFEGFKKFLEQTILPHTESLKWKERDNLRNQIRFAATEEELKEKWVYLNQSLGLNTDYSSLLKDYANQEQKPIPLITSIIDYIRNVREFSKVQPFFYDKNKLFWFWNKLRFKWEIVDEIDVMLKIDNELGLNGQTVCAKIKNDYLEAFKRIGRENQPKPVPKNWVQFKDKIVDVQTSEEIDPTPEYFVTNPIPYKIGCSDNTPTIDKIFGEWTGFDNIQSLYEILAYALLPDYPLNRIFCLLGSGSNGKSCFLEIIKKFVGNENVTSTELETLLHSRFELTKLYKKLVCFMGETNFTELKKTSILKKLSGGDLIGFEYKNKTPFDDHNYAKLIIATNNLPSTTDKTDGFYRRWKIVDFPQKFTEKKDILAEIPEEEYENLSCKCIPILRDLLIKREFTNEGTIQERAQKYEEKSNPLDKFLKDKTEEDCSENGYIFKYDFKDKLWDWCKQNNFRKISETEIGRKMKSLGYASGKIQTEWYENEKERKRYNAWLGIKWKE